MAGVLLLTGVLVAVLLPLGNNEAAPTTSTEQTQSRTQPGTTSTPPTTSIPPATTAPAPVPSGPLRVVSVGPFAATVEWVGPDAPTHIGYGLPSSGRRSGHRCAAGAPS